MGSFLERLANENLVIAHMVRPVDKEDFSLMVQSLNQAHHLEIQQCPIGESLCRVWLSSGKKKTNILYASKALLCNLVNINSVSSKHDEGANARALNNDREVSLMLLTFEMCSDVEIEKP